MIGLSDIQAKDEIRRTMAEQIATWEAENGPVQTLPIRIGDAPVETFSINVPGKPKAMPASSQALRAKDHARVTLRTQKKMAKVESIHPTQKPVKLYQWLLSNYAKPGDKILDTHLGSGSSAIAAHYAGFDFVGIELDQDYYRAAVRRFDLETRQAALFS